MSKYLYAVAAAALVSSPAMAVTNGGFEDPNVTNPCCTTSPSDPLPGWTITTGDVNVVNGTFSSTNGNLAYEGNQYLDLIGQQNSGGISQLLSLTAGQRYMLTFAYSHNLFANLGSASAALSVGDLTDSVTHSTGSNADLDWRIYTGYFTAGATNTLSFTSTVNGTNSGILLDAISISAVPEPATWAMMIGGFGMVGGAMRRSRRKATVAYA